MKKEKLKSIFVNMKKKDSIPHCIIIHGNNKNEKKEVVDFISQLILCQTHIKDDDMPCSKCNSCIKFKANTHPDLNIVIGEGKTGIISVDKARNIKEDAYIIPTESERKVYVIADAQNMTIQAQNALLKVIEEPPKGVYFIITCIKADSMLETIRSRAQAFATDNIESQINAEDRAFSIAKNIINDIINREKEKLFLSSADFIKDKNLLIEVLSQLEIISGDIIRYKFSGIKSEYCYEDFFDKASQEAFLNLIDIIDDTMNKIKANANQNLLVTCFFMQLLDL